MSNNQNELNDIMDVLVENAGYLTEYDRAIPEDDEAVIRTSAWSHIPVLLTEDEQIRRWMQNNQVHIIDYNFQSSEKSNKQLFEMRRRSRAASESRRQSLMSPGSVDSQPTEYHYIYGDISDEMSAMSMNQQPLYEDNADTTRSSSPESDTSSGSEWCPGPSSIDTNTNKSDSPSPFEPETEGRRLSKSQKKTMTEDQLEKRRKEANKKNSKNYNKNKKAKEQELSQEMERIKGWNTQKKGNNMELRKMIHECYTFTGTVIRISDEEVMRTFINKDAFEERLKAIDADALRIKHSDVNIRKLSQTCIKKRDVYKKADEDIQQKRDNINTYGSRKSRALHSKNIAELQLKLAELEFDRQRLSTREAFMNRVKAQMSSIFTFRYIGAEYPLLPADRKAHFDHLCGILKQDSPTSSTSNLRRPP